MLITEKYPTWFQEELYDCTFTDDSRYTFWIPCDQRNPDYYEKQLVEDYLIGDGVEVQNITINGQPDTTVNNQAGLYGGTSDFIDFNSGLLMVTANAKTAANDCCTATASFTSGVKTIC